MEAIEQQSKPARMSKTAYEAMVEVNAKLSALASKIDCMTEHEVAYLCGVDRKTLVQWRARGRGPSYVRLGTEFMYPIKSVRDWATSKLKRMNDLSLEDL